MALSERGGSETSMSPLSGLCAASSVPPLSPLALSRGAPVATETVTVSAGEKRKTAVITPTEGLAVRAAAAMPSSAMSAPSDGMATGAAAAGERSNGSDIDNDDNGDGPGYLCGGMKEKVRTRAQCQTSVLTRAVAPTKEASGDAGSSSGPRYKQHPAAVTPQSLSVTEEDTSANRTMTTTTITTTTTPKKRKAPTATADGEEVNVWISSPPLKKRPNHKRKVSAAMEDCPVGEMEEESETRRQQGQPQGSETNAAQGEKRKRSQSQAQAQAQSQTQVQGGTLGKDTNKALMPTGALAAASALMTLIQQ